MIYEIRGELAIRVGHYRYQYVYDSDLGKPVYYCLDTDLLCSDAESDRLFGDCAGNGSVSCVSCGEVGCLLIHGRAHS